MRLITRVIVFVLIQNLSPDQPYKYNNVYRNKNSDLVKDLRVLERCIEIPNCQTIPSDFLLWLLHSFVKKIHTQCILFKKIILNYTKSGQKFADP